MQTKRCSECKVVKPLEGFKKQKDCKYGVCSQCRVCKAEYDKQYRVKNRERRIEYDKQYRVKNRERRIEYDKQYQSENKERIAECKKRYYAIPENKERRAEYDKRYRAEHKEQIAERKKQWKKDNPDKVRAASKQHYVNNPDKYRVKSRKRRALKRAVEENFTPFDEGITRAVYHRKCFRCGSTDQLEIDHHQPLSAGNALELGNAVLLCKSCNSSKGAKEPITFYTANELLRRMTYRKMQEAIAETLRDKK